MNCNECGKELESSNVWYVNFDENYETPLCYGCCNQAEEKHDFPSGIPEDQLDIEYAEELECVKRC